MSTKPQGAAAVLNDELERLHAALARGGPVVGSMEGALLDRIDRLHAELLKLAHKEADARLAGLLSDGERQVLAEASAAADAADAAYRHDSWVLGPADDTKGMDP